VKSQNFSSLESRDDDSFEDLVDYNVNLSKANSFDSICLQISHGKAAIDHRSRRRALQGGGHQEVQEHA
jgi:hypothetical protein